MYPQQRREISSGLEAGSQSRSIYEISLPEQTTGAGLQAERAMDSGELGEGIHI